MKPENCLSDSTLDLFCDKADHELAEEFVIQIEQQAAILGITCDYYMAEFM